MNRWSSTKFADLLRGTPKPSSETGEGWRAWEKAAKAAHPFRYWLAEEALDGVQWFLRLPISLYESFSAYVNNRFVFKTHLMSSSLKAGSRWDFDSKLLQCAFHDLVEFVECERPWRHGEEERSGLKPPLFVRIFGIGKWRCPELGLKHLEWEMSLVYDDNWTRDVSLHGKPTPQAIAAKEIFALYNWWKSVRPQRKDPWDEKGPELEYDEDGIFPLRYTPEWEAFTNWCHEEEERHTAEDEEMLIRLVKVRGRLWY